MSTIVEKVNASTLYGGYYPARLPKDLEMQANYYPEGKGEWYYGDMDHGKVVYDTLQGPFSSYREAAELVTERIKSNPEKYSPDDFNGFICCYEGLNTLDKVNLSTLYGCYWKDRLPTEAENQQKEGEWFCGDVCLSGEYFSGDNEYSNLRGIVPSSIQGPFKTYAEVTAAITENIQNNPQKYHTGMTGLNMIACLYQG